MICGQTYEQAVSRLQSCSLSLLRFDVIQDMPHLSRDALARYLIKTDSQEERIGVDWHLVGPPGVLKQVSENPVCIRQIEQRKQTG